MTQRKPSERLAESLRQDPPQLDDVARVRMERAFLGARRGEAGRPRRSSRRVSAFAWGVGIGLAAAAAFVLLRAPASSESSLALAPEQPASSARLE
ncbi:MAG: hypothetical protein GXP55_23495, partial [Deltaproteobacteria bacterium]|nr:hypothetical protein [Deltaproteobacteria bacterium]